MPPNVQSTQDDKIDDNVEKQQVNYKDCFWACDLKGLNELKNYVKKTYDELEQLHEIYVARAELEHAFGEKLEELVNSHSRNIKNDTTKKAALTGSLDIVYKELSKSAQSHLDFSKRLQKSVGEELYSWIQCHRERLKNIMQPVVSLYEDRQNTIEQLYDTRVAYQALDKDSSKRQTLQNDYRLLLNKVDGVIKKWHIDWQCMCDQIEQLEQDRVDFFTTNVWDYANLASARLMVQDEWCEAIRSHLESCSFEDERSHCIQQISTGKRMPTTSDYVTHYFSQWQKESQVPQQRSVPLGTKKEDTKPINKSLPTRPPQTSPPQQMSSIKRKPVLDQSTIEDKKVTAPMALEAILKKFESKSDVARQQREQRQQHQHQQQQRQRQHRSLRGSPDANLQDFTNDKGAGITREAKEEQDTWQNLSQKHQQQEKRFTKSDEDNKYPKKSQSPKTSANQTDQQTQACHVDNDQQTETFVSSPPPAPKPPTDNVKKQQHSSVGMLPPKSPRPSTQTIVTSQGNNTSGNTNTLYSSNGPSSSCTSLSSASSSSNSSPPSRTVSHPPPIDTSVGYMHLQNPPKSPAQQYMPPSSPSVSQQQKPPSSPMTAPLSMAPNVGSNAGSSVPVTMSPMFYPSGAPAMANFQPGPPGPPSPIMTQTHQQTSYTASPMMQPLQQQICSPYQQQHLQQQHQHQHQQHAYNPPTLHSPNFLPASSQPLRPGPPSPLQSSSPAGWSQITSPAVSRANSPFLSHTTPASSSSISRPSSPCIQRPTMLPDGTEILFWCQSMYDYSAHDAMEISFKAHTLFAVYYVAPDGWWDASAFDGHYFVGTSGSIPSNYMRRL